MERRSHTIAPRAAWSDSVLVAYQNLLWNKAPHHDASLGQTCLFSTPTCTATTTTRDKTARDVTTPTPNNQAIPQATDTLPSFGENLSTAYGVTYFGYYVYYGCGNTGVYIELHSSGLNPHRQSEGTLSLTR